MYPLIEERLEEDDLVTWLNKGHEGAEHTLICSSCNSHFGVWVYFFTEERRVRICYRFLQPWSTLCLP